VLVMSSSSAVIVDAIRTAGGKRNGALSGWHPVDLGAEVLAALVDRNGLDPTLVDDVIMGCVMQVGDQALNIGRSSVLAAGFPESVPATTIDRQCGSSQQSLHFAPQGIIAGAYEIAIAAGVEVMSTTPMGSSKTRVPTSSDPSCENVTPASAGLSPRGSQQRSSPNGGIFRESRWMITAHAAGSARYTRATGGISPARSCRSS
jgi:acetyl-CoA acyltransferase